MQIICSGNHINIKAAGSRNNQVMMIIQARKGLLKDFL
jgi:hypothetical protein